MRRIPAVLLVVLVACGGGGNNINMLGGGAPNISSFTATPNSLPAGGGTVTLAWSISGATSSSISGPGTFTAVTATSASGYVSNTATFTLSATNAIGTTTATATVTVAAPVVTDYAPQYVGTWAGNASGAEPSYQYTQASNGDVVTVYPELVAAAWPATACEEPVASPATVLTVTEVSTNVIQISGMLNATLPEATVGTAAAALPSFSGEVTLFEEIYAGCFVGTVTAPATFQASDVSLTNGELQLNLTGTFADPATGATEQLFYVFSGMKQ